MTVAVPDVVEGEVCRSADEWVVVIRADLTKAVEGTIAAGKNLAKAKAEVGHGAYMSVVLPGVGISQQWAQRLMAIGSHGALSNHQNSGDLPKSPDALYALSRCSIDEVESGIASGRITPQTTIAQAKAYYRELNPPPPEPEPAPLTQEEVMRPVLRSQAPLSAAVMAA